MPFLRYRPGHRPGHRPGQLAPTGAVGSPTPLLVTADPALAEDVRRLAAAAGTTVDVRSGVPEAGVAWPWAPLVLVGADLVAEAAASAPARRDQVHVVARGNFPEDRFPAALAVGAQTVLELPASEPWLVEALADAADGTVASARLVGVVGGCGGAGASTFAAALAAVAATDLGPATLVDADPLGAGLERIAGLDEDQGAGWASLTESVGRLSARSLRAALPRGDGFTLLGWGEERREPVDPRVAREAVSAARRGSTVVVLDLPRHADSASRELVQRCDAIVVVTPLALLAVAAAARTVSSLVGTAARLHLVTRGRAGSLDPEEVATALGVPLAAAMVDQRRLEESVELGLGPLATRRGALARAARATLAEVLDPVGGAR